MTDRLRGYFADYEAFHKTRGNEVCHFVAVPVIVFSVLALAARVPLLPAQGVTLAEVVIAGSFAFYFSLDPLLAVGMLVLSAGLDGLGRYTPWTIAVALFVAAWILQFVGHYAFEKRSPAFFRNVLHLLIGPLWVLARAVRHDPIASGPAGGSPSDAPSALFTPKPR